MARKGNRCRLLTWRGWCMVAGIAVAFLFILGYAVYQDLSVPPRHTSVWIEGPPGIGIREGQQPPNELPEPPEMKP